MNDQFLPERTRAKHTGFWVRPEMYNVSQSSKSRQSASTEMTPYFRICGRGIPSVSGDSGRARHRPSRTLPLISTSTLNQTSAPSPFSCIQATAFEPRRRIVYE